MSKYKKQEVMIVYDVSMANGAPINKSVIGKLKKDASLVDIVSGHIIRLTIFGSVTHNTDKNPVDISNDYLNVDKKLMERRLRGYNKLLKINKYKVFAL